VTGYAVHRDAVPVALCTAARRRLLLELRRSGLNTADLAVWSYGTWWPDLRGEPEFDAVRDALEKIVDRSGTTRWCETQLLLRLPDEDGTPLGGPHTDTLPPWADGWRYRRIYGVELTDTAGDGGGTVLYPSGDPLARPDGSVRPVQCAGDALEMSPDLPHSGSPNMSADIRMALFFRLLDRSVGGSQ